MSKALSLVQRDSFFDDAFFTDSWDDFDTAMKSVLSKFEEKSDFSTRNTCTDVYRKLRTSNIEQDLYASQALQVTEKDGKFQCVMDVKDFNPNELQVKVVDDKVTVEGKYEKKSEDGKSMSSKSFFKEFTLGTADLEQVATALSKDGVLTIKAPKRETGVVAAAPSGPVTKSTSSSVQESSSSVSEESDNSKSVSSAVKKTSFSSTSSSSFSSSSTSSFSSSNTKVGSNVIQESAIEDMEKDLNNRLVFTHDTVNVKLPAAK